MSKESDKMNDIQQIQKQLNQWKLELDSDETISNEGLLLEWIKEGEGSLALANPAIYSNLLSTFALHLRHKKFRLALVKFWMDMALSFNPSNQDATMFLNQYQWMEKKDFIQNLNFPPIRETDNRTTKSKIAKQFIDTCGSFLSDLESFKEKMVVQSNDLRSRNILELLGDMEEAVSHLLHVSKLYDESITGVFHNSAYLTEIHRSLTIIDQLKAKWSELFQEEYRADEKRQALDELNHMIGLESVKARVHQFYRFLKYQKKRKVLGLQSTDVLSLNMILTGNPGTGKTTLARLLAKIYYELGVLPREEVVETNRSQLVGSFVGQTEENVRNIVEKALGGVLFIDEAYSLKRDDASGSDYGQTAIDTLVSLMTSNEFGGKFAVILAGYPEEMRSFLHANPGLRSRFPVSNIIELPNYSNEELVEIGVKIAHDNDYFLTDSAKKALSYKIDQERVDQTFGNARAVKNIILESIFRKGASFINESEHKSSYSILDREDIIGKLDRHLQISPKERLHQLVGLDSIKKEVESLVSFVEVQQERNKQGLPTVPLQLHSVFTGNPGTGKTTVAKIFAELLKECGLLKRGHLVTVGRADLTAGYVGQTALKTKKKIREALGGVLFIDEAYSLFRESPGDFGKEAIDTIVEEMTKHHENLVIILAGYPNEMERLLSSNPGLKSRFKKFFYFPDYQPKELITIMKNIAHQYEYILEDPCFPELLKRLEEVRPNGNGRLAENLIYTAIEQQAVRLSKQQKISNEIELKTITLTDVLEAWEQLRSGESI